MNHHHLVGILIGVAAATIVAWWVGVRNARRIRAAERRARAAERLAEIGAMTGGLAHEIKNPLSTIGLNAQLLEEAIAELDADEDLRGRLLRRTATLAREVERLRGILTDFLEYAGEVHLTRAPADLNVIVDELTDFFAPQAERQGVRLRTDLAPSLPTAQLDAAHVKQAALNLMLNAAQAMSGNADRTRDLILKTDDTADDDGKPCVRLHVIDTGPGLAPDTAAHIFDPYFTTKAGGSGLGLPTARRLVEAHGGHIELFTQPGSGSSFVLSFPAAK